METEPLPAGAGDDSSPALKRLGILFGARSFAAKYGVLIGLIVTTIVFSVLRPHVFPTHGNLSAIVDQTSPVLIVALGLTVVLVMGDFDLSIVGSIGLASAVVVILMAHHGVAWPLAILAAFGVAVVIGVGNGSAIAGIGASSFVITLASGQFLSGLELRLTDGNVIFTNIPHSYLNLSVGQLFGIHYVGYVALVLFVIFYLLLNHSQVGRHMYAIGGNREAARLSGIPVTRLRILGYVLTAFCCVVAAIQLTGLAGSYSNDLSASFFLPTYAAVFLGAAVLRPGMFNIVGTLIGAVFLEVISTGLTILALPSSVVLMVQGGILAVAVLLSTIARRAR